MKTILVAATHRSGSYLACDWLSNAGVLPFPEEHFNFDLKTAREELRLPESVPSNIVLEALMDRRGATHEIFTVKAMWTAFSQLFTKLTEIESEIKSFETTVLQWLHKPTVLFIRRRDKFRQAVSFEIAKQTSVWRKPREEESRKFELVYSYPRILACWDQIHQDEARWLHFFKACGLGYHEIWYEDLLAEPNKEIKLALEYIGVETEIERPPISRFVKQGNACNREWTERFKARHSISEEKEVLTSAKKSSKGESKGNIPNAPNCVHAHIRPQISKIEMKPSSSVLITVELTNMGNIPWNPELNARERSDYFLELRYSNDSGKKFLWQAELEELVRPGESTELTLRIKSNTILESFDCDLSFNHPEGVLEVPRALSVEIQVDEKWEVISRIFHQIDLSEKSGWIHIKVFGDVWIEKFPFIYLLEHGWIFIDKENSSPGILCAMDFELDYFAVHLNRPREFHIFPKDSNSTKHLEFLGVKEEMRLFKDLQTGEIFTCRLSYQSDLDDLNPT